jgi:hypothetical protein
MSSKKIANSTFSTITTTEICQYSKQILSKGKKPLYLVLRAKSFEEEIVESVQEEANKKFIKYIKTKIGKLLQSEPKDPETFLKYFLIKAYIHVLSEIFEEYKITLSEKDQKLLFDILNTNPEEEDKKDDENNNINKKEK